MTDLGRPDAAMADAAEPMDLGFQEDGGYEEDAGGVDSAVDNEPPIVLSVAPRPHSLITGSMPRFQILFSESMQPADTVPIVFKDMSGQGAFGFADLRWSMGSTLATGTFMSRPRSMVFVDVAQLTDLAGNPVVGSDIGDRFQVTWQTE